MRRPRGFTLVEMIAVITVMAIIGAMVAVFVRGPIFGYVDTARRAALADTADTALRRVARDLRLALPNSVRISGDGLALELLLTRGGGRYRADCPAGNPLVFGTVTAWPCEGAADNLSFDVLGPVGVPVYSTDLVAVSNQGATTPDYNAYVGDNVRTASTVGLTGVSSISYAGPGFPGGYESPGRRFQIVQGPVSYICTGGQLRRYASYAKTVAQTTIYSPPTLPGGGYDLLAGGVTGCAFTYDASVVASRNGLVTLSLTLTSSGESVTLYHAVHVSNVP